MGLIVLHPDGRIETDGENLVFPYGNTISDDGRTLVVAESLREPRASFTSFDVAPAGTLVRQRVFAEFGAPSIETVVGTAIDSEGAVWAVFPWMGEFRRVCDRG